MCVDLLDDIDKFRTGHADFNLCYPYSEGSLAKSLKILELKAHQSHSRGRSDAVHSRVVLEQMLPEAAEYLSKIRLRVLDSSSKVLITGDLNSGKSTMINAILQMDILPTDQQPCTQSFCEVIPSRDEGKNGKILAYVSTSLDGDGEEIGRDDLHRELQSESTSFQWFKIFIDASHDSASIHSNIAVSFIDSPGLNTDLFKTTSLFTQQRDIDVVVFVINASFHLTLSGREFLEQAAKEKVHVFFIVNRFDEIENPEKCQTLIMRQIKDILPETFRDSHSLIHFVSAKAYLEAGEQHSLVNGSAHSPTIETRAISLNDDSVKRASLHASFGAMKESLMNFVHLKRSLSKLAPAKTFATRLLQDLLELSAFNARRLASEARTIDAEIEACSPEVKQRTLHESVMLEGMSVVVETVSAQCYSTALHTARNFSDSVHKAIAMQRFHGVFRIRAFANSIFLLASEKYREMTACVEHEAMELVASGLADMRALTDGYGLLEPLSVGDGPILNLPDRMPVPRPSLLELIDPTAMLQSFGVLNATSLLSVAVGYQPLINLVWRLADHLGLSPVLMTATVFGGIGAFAVYAASSTVERMMRTRMDAILASRFNKDVWAAGLAERCQQAVMVRLSAKASRVAANYRQMLEDKRRELHTHSSQLERLNGEMLFLRDTSRRIEGLLGMAAEIQL